jgi:hypothetical protein
VKKSGESFRMFQIILVFLAWNYQIMYLFDIGMLEFSMVLLVFDFVYVLIKWLQFVCVCVCVCVGRGVWVSILSCSTSCGNKWTSCTKL